MFGFLNVLKPPTRYMVYRYTFVDVLLSFFLNLPVETMLPEMRWDPRNFNQAGLKDDFMSS